MILQHGKGYNDQTVPCQILQHALNAILVLIDKSIYQPLVLEGIEIIIAMGEYVFFLLCNK